MTNTEFVEVIENWKSILFFNGVKMPNGKSIPEKFWPAFLGYSEGAYFKFKGSSEDPRTIKKYTAKHVKLIDRLPLDAFIEEVELSMKEFVITHPRYA